MRVRLGKKYLHGNTKVHHGHAGVAVPAHVHRGVATVRRLPLQRRARGTQVVLGLLVHPRVVRGFWEIQ